MKTDLFQSCVHCWVFQICWHIECSTFTASSFSIWNSSTGIPSPPLALFVVMLSKAHLTSQSRMSGSRWVITPLWLSQGIYKRKQNLLELISEYKHSHWIQDQHTKIIWILLMKEHLYFKARHVKLNIKFSVYMFGPPPFLSNVQYAFSLHINQTSSKVGVPAWL